MCEFLKMALYSLELFMKHGASVKGSKEWIMVNCCHQGRIGNPNIEAITDFRHEVMALKNRVAVCEFIESKKAGK